MGVPGGGAARDLGGAGEGGDGLPVGGADGRVPAQGELDEQHGQAEHGQRPQTDDGDRECHHRAGRADGGADAEQSAQFLAQQGAERPAGAAVGERGGQDRPAQGGEGEQGEQQEGVGGAAPMGEGALAVEGLEADGGEADGEDPAGQVVDGGAAAGPDVRDGAEHGGDEDDGDDLGGSVLAGPPGVGAEQGVRQGAGGTEGRGLPLSLFVAPPGQFADGYEHAEGERDALVVQAGPEGDGEGAGRDEGGGAVDQPQGGHRGAPVLGVRSAGGVPCAGSSAVTAGCQPERRRARTSAPTIRGSKCAPAQRSSSATAASTGRALL